MLSSHFRFLPIFALSALAACGGGSSGAPSAVAPSVTQGAVNGPATEPVKESTPQPAVRVLAATSYENFKNVGLTSQTLPSWDLARAYGDFSGSGQLDFFRAVETYDLSLPASQATPSRFEFYKKQADGSFILSPALLPQSSGCIHPRKAIVADFNKDGRPDVFVVCHGYDKAPFPGEKNKVVLSQANGTYQVTDASDDIGFFHGATAADLNGDGKIDVLVVNNFDPERAFVLLNDGSGRFTRESLPRLPTSIRNKPYFSVELVDINEDGKLDLLLGGHEWEGASTSIFLNPGSNNFTGVTPINIPAVANEGVVLDFTVTGSGTTRALWILRTSGGDGTFYQSKVIQKVQYPLTSNTSVVLNQRPARWVPWLIPAVVNGANVITSDNAADAVALPQ